MSDVVGGVVGFPIGLRLRRAYFNRKLRRVNRNPRRQGACSGAFRRIPGLALLEGRRCPAS